MNLETKLLNRLKSRQQTFALEALQRPNTKDTFEYGRSAGVIAGLEMALETLVNCVKEEREGNDDL